MSSIAPRKNCSVDLRAEFLATHCGIDGRMRPGFNMEILLEKRGFGRAVRIGASRALFPLNYSAIRPNEALHLTAAACRLFVTAAD